MVSTARSQLHSACLEIRSVFPKCNYASLSNSLCILWLWNFGNVKLVLKYLRAQLLYKRSIVYCRRIYRVRFRVYNFYEPYYCRGSISFFSLSSFGPDFDNDWPLCSSSTDPLRRFLLSYRDRVKSNVRLRKHTFFIRNFVYSF